MKKRQILVIDDDRAMCQLIEKMLERRYSVVVMSDGIQAMQWLISGQIPSLIITDIDMPNLNGYEFLKNIKISGYFKNVPVIVITGYDDAKQKARCLDLGADDYFIKPFNPSTLIESIENTLIKTTKLIVK
ncbi:MAG: response regulator [Cyclobacteriaceae bacterium]|nr:response regulator [Cyclobacteriaceae bacterium]